MLKGECHDEGDRLSEAADQRKERTRSKLIYSTTSVDMSSPALDERPSSEGSYFENERGYLPAFGSRIVAEPNLFGSHPGLVWRHVLGGRTAYTRTWVVVGNTVLDPDLALSTPYLYRRILRLRLCCAACLFRDLSSC